GFGGAVQRVDYFADYAHFQTDNSVPNNAYRNNTFATRVGAMLGSNINLSGTIRWIDTSYGLPNAIDYYDIPDDSSQRRRTAYGSIAAQSQIGSRLQSTVRFGVSDQTYHAVNPTPTGTRSDPSQFANFLGNTVTISGANGYSVTGRAILDFGGDYPSPFDSTGNRKLISGEISYHAASTFHLAGGAPLENADMTSTFRGETASTH